MAKTINYTDSMNDVVSTVGPVLQVFLNEVVKAEMSDCNFVYDPNLSYETAIKKFRSDSQMNDDSISPMPLFIFRRTQLKWNEEGLAPNRRLTSYKAAKKNLSDGNTLIYTPLHAEFDIEFLYLNKTMEDIEKFEIVYLSDEGISGTREFTLDLPELGDFKYFADYNELQDLSVEFENNYYKGLVGVITVRGMFFTFRSESPIIKSIGINYKNWINDIGTDDIKSDIILE